MGHQVLGAPCDNTTYYAFGIADGYVSFSSEARTADVLRLAADDTSRDGSGHLRWRASRTKAPSATSYQNYVAQAPDGLFLICIAHDGIETWVRADT